MRAAVVSRSAIVWRERDIHRTEEELTIDDKITFDIHAEAGGNQPRHATDR